MRERILRPHETVWARDPVSQVGVLVDGENYYAMLYECARRAEKYILLSGWQFDSKVELVRGKEAEKAEGDTRLLAFLNQLCEKNEALRIYILAWDFSVVYALEREWLQSLAFDWTTHAHLKFVFDECVPLEGAHHQKFVVVDGIVGFVGGMDICEHRWDDRSHTIDNPLRTVADGTLYTPYHETHAYLAGPAVARLTDFFRTRWQCASKEPLEIEPRTTPMAIPPNGAIPIAARELGFARTAVAGPDAPLHEVRALYTAAIAAAERVIYVENQYLSARAIGEALEARMRDASKPKLDLVFMLPTEPEAPKEAMAMGVAQARLVNRLRAVARSTGHRIGFYSSVAVSPTGDEVATYIHSKLLIVDDRFLTLGSANLNNRSMGVDTELNVAFEDEDARSPLGESIRDLRVDLLSEHLGATDPDDVAGLADGQGLVQRLDAIASARRLRLRHYVAVDPALADPTVDVVQTSIGDYLDPEEPALERDLESPARWKEMFARGISRLKERFL
jgi:phosphatidylserine/phosphatidylglycerophosphate/cardiolipin synthase-like enzyme